MRFLLKLLLFTSSLFFVNGALYAVDFGNQTLSSNQFARMYNYGYTLAFFDCGGPDSTKAFTFNPLVCQNVNKAYNHVQVEVFMTPVYKTLAADITGQITTIFTEFTKCKITVTTIWIKITNGTESGWTKVPKSNSDFLVALMTAIKAHPATIGIYTSKETSDSLFGDTFDFTATTNPVASYATGLWYIRSPTQATFNDFIPFGGFKQANVKQFAQNVEYDSNSGRKVNRDVWIQKATVTKPTVPTAGGNII